MINEIEMKAADGEYCMVGKFGRERFGEFTCFEHLAKKV